MLYKTNNEGKRWRKMYRIKFRKLLLSNSIEFDILLRNILWFLNTTMS